MREAGIKGFKLHPMVNSYYPDDPRMFPFYEEMGDDMVVEIHSGRWAHTQPGDTIWAEPARIMNVVQAVPQAEADRAAPGRVLHAGRGGAGAHRAGERADRHHLAAGAEGAGQRDAWRASSAATALKRFASAPISRWQTCRRTRSSSSRCPCPMRRRSRCWARTPGS